MKERVQWSCFDIMKRILGHKPTTVQKSVVDSLALTQNEGITSESLEVSEVNEVDETLFGEVMVKRQLHLCQLSLLVTIILE